MYYTYILQSQKNGKLYVGSTSDLRKRFKDYNDDFGGSFTKSNRPFKLIYYGSFFEKKKIL